MAPTLCRNSQCVMIDGEMKHLTTNEFRILEFLMDHPSRFHTAEEIYEHAWQMEPFNSSPIIYVHIRHLREKMESDPSDPQYIISAHKKGYQFQI